MSKSCSAMNGQLVAHPPGYETTQLLELVQDLKREVVSLRQEVADLRQENLKLRQEAGYWNGGAYLLSCK